eukprot:Hpha_TRINITY_DN17773_c0_g1::TRINITY_DN17773_c0_g1_i1::g.46353::m.46353/K12189/VPS25, EAP20; ESCRT-II complex subunit VPS25
MAQGGFDFPAWYGLAPSFTLQPAASTRRKQLQLWNGLMVEYCKQRRQWTLGPEDTLFNNKAISRQLSLENAVALLEALVAAGQASWRDKVAKANGVYVLWEGLGEWANMIHKWVDSRGDLGTVMTVMELRETDGVAWQGAPEDSMLLFLGELERQGRAAVMHSPD